MDERGSPVPRQLLWARRIWRVSTVVMWLALAAFIVALCVGRQLAWGDEIIIGLLFTMMISGFLNWRLGFYSQIADVLEGKTDRIV